MLQRLWETNAWSITSLCCRVKSEASRLRGHFFSSTVNLLVVFVFCYQSFHIVQFCSFPVKEIGYWQFLKCLVIMELNSCFSVWRILNNFALKSLNIVEELWYDKGNLRSCVFLYCCHLFKFFLWTLFVFKVIMTINVVACKMFCLFWMVFLICNLSWFDH